MPVYGAFIASARPGAAGRAAPAPGYSLALRLAGPGSESGGRSSPGPAVAGPRPALQGPSRPGSRAGRGDRGSDKQDLVQVQVGPGRGS